MIVNEEDTFCPSSPQEWRNWLKKNHQKRQSVWLVYFSVKSGKSTLTWSEAVDQALCYGWIDSTRKTRDEESSYQFFCKRKPKSAWSKINKAKILHLIETKQMAQAGLDAVEIAKENGSWTLLDEIEELTIPAELAEALQSRPVAEEFFSGLSKSVKKMMLHWITMAKRPETRTKRIAELVDCAAERKKPKQF